MEQQEITVCAAITISGPLVYHLIRWNVDFFLRQHLQVKMFEVADALPDNEVPVARGKRLRKVFGWVHWLSSLGIGPNHGD